jgi:hypothetical protein
VTVVVSTVAARDRPKSLGRARPPGPGPSDGPTSPRAPLLTVTTPGGAPASGVGAAPAAAAAAGSGRLSKTAVAPPVVRKGLSSKSVAPAAPLPRDKREWRTGGGLPARLPAAASAKQGRGRVRAAERSLFPQLRLWARHALRSSGSPAHALTCPRTTRALTRTSAETHTRVRPSAPLFPSPPPTRPHSLSPFNESPSARLLAARSLALHLPPTLPPSAATSPFPVPHRRSHLPPRPCCLRPRVRACACLARASYRRQERRQAAGHLAHPGRRHSAPWTRPWGGRGRRCGGGGWGCCQPLRAPPVPHGSGGAGPAGGAPAAHYRSLSRRRSCRRSCRRSRRRSVRGLGKGAGVCGREGGGNRSPSGTLAGLSSAGRLHTRLGYNCVSVPKLYLYRCSVPLAAAKGLPQPPTHTRTHQRPPPPLHAHGQRWGRGGGALLSDCCF